MGSASSTFSTALPFAGAHRERTTVRQALAIVIIIFLLAAIVPAGSAQNVGTAPNQGVGQAGNSAAQDNVLRITSPKPGEKLRQNFVNLQFELTNAAASASGTPNFQIRLDNLDPVTTSSTQYTFNGLSEGTHTVMVQLVDANNTPVAGARSEVQFIVLRPAAPSPSAGLRKVDQAIKAALRVEGPQGTNRKDIEGQQLPEAGGALPLLSVIGFGVLLGGIASALKTR